MSPLEPTAKNSDNQTRPESPRIPGRDIDPLPPTPTPAPGNAGRPARPASPGYKGDHPYHPDATNDPLVGTQQHPDQAVEMIAEPEKEAAPWPTAGAPSKSRLLAGLLGIFLGGLGVHRFYLDYVEVGLCQLAMFLLTFGAVVIYGLAIRMPAESMFLIACFTSALVWLWGAVEGIMILAGMMPHDGHGRPLPWRKR